MSEPSDARLPFCLAMVLCNGVHEDPDMGKMTVLGTVTHVWASSLPVQVFALWVYVVFTEVIGEVPIAFRLVDVDGELVLDEWEGETSSDDPLQAIEFRLGLPGATFPALGEYRLQLFARDEFVIERRIFVAPRSGSAE